MSQANQAETVPSTPQTNIAPHPHPRTRPLISPLARAALDNGVSFADVQAYVQSMPWTNPVYRDQVERAWYEAVNVPEQHAPVGSALAAHVTEMVTDTVLEGALLRSVLAIGTIEHARLWWRGVL